MPEPNHTKKSSKQTFPKIRFFLLSFIPFVVFSLGFIPPIVAAKLILYGIPFTNIAAFILLPFIMALELLILLVSEILISGAIIRVFGIKYDEGTYEYSVKDNTAFNWMLLCQLYTPMRKMLEIIPMGYIKIVYLRLLGMKIGENTLLGCTIKDPCVTEIGCNTTIGEYAILYGHIHDYQKGTLTINKIRIGNNCIVGAGAIIMPGVVMEDSAVLGAGGLATKNRVLEKNKIYGGNPAKEIQITKSGAPEKES
jgi:hypothetical protein